jgi:hypothetical protein
MAFTIHIKYLDEPELQLHSPPYQVSCPQGDHIGLTSYKNGSITDEDAFVIRPNTCGALTVDQWVLAINGTRTLNYIFS